MRKQSLVVILLLWLLLPLTAAAQSEPALTLRLERNFGAGFGTQIRGTFSMRADGPENLERVVFFIDGDPIGEDTEAPFRLQFQTNRFALGVHTLSATGITADGRELPSNQLQREFISSSASTNRMFYILIPIMVLVVGGRLLTTWLANRGRRQADKPVINGPLGGTICPNCHTPYAFHWWSLNFVLGRIDRCPHCGAWRFVRRLHPEVLNASLEAAEAIAAQKSEDADDNDLHRKLDDSRFTE